MGRIVREKDYEKYKDIDLGNVFVPERLLTDRVKLLFSHFRSMYKTREDVWNRMDHFVDMLCFISHASYMKHGECLSTGELKIACQLAEILYGQTFKADFKKLVELDKKTFSIRQGLPNSRRINAFGIHCTDKRIIFSKIQKDSVRYKALQVMTGKFLEYLKEHTEYEMPEEYQEWADNYRKYRIDMKLASEICKERHGVSFDDVVSYMNSRDSVLLSEADFFKYRDADNERQLCKAFNDNSYIVKEVYGRLYTPFHNLAKEYREAFRTRENGDKLVELTDMSGAFVRGGLCVAGCMSFEFGNEALYKKINDICHSFSDPYSFAVRDGYTRNDIKKPVLSFLFAKPSHLRMRDNLFTRIEKNADVDKVYSYCVQFLSFINKNKQVYCMSDRDMNKALTDFSQESCISDVFGYNMKRRMFWTNSTAKNVRNSLLRFVNTLTRVRDAILHNHVSESLKTQFGADVYSALRFTGELFNHATEYNINKEQEAMKRFCENNGALPYRKVDLQKGNTINTSIVCQLSEGEMMFKEILPTLKVKTGCTKLVTLHDGIFCPASVVPDVNVDMLNMSLNAWFSKFIMKTYVNNEMVRDAVKLWKKHNMNTNIGDYAYGLC